jgi:hypothetical protein
MTNTGTATIANGAKVRAGRKTGIVKRYSRGWYLVESDGSKRAYRRAQLAVIRRSDSTELNGGSCACGCGSTCKPHRHFAQGHDARFHGWMRRIAQDIISASEIPASAAKLMTIVNGTPTTDYDGSVWKL